MEWVDKIREDFVMNQIYFDNAASTLKPKQVINALNDFYLNHYANVHRGIYRLSEEATEMYENARRTIAKFVDAKPNETIFTKNASESLNLVADSLVRYFRDNLKAKRINILTTEIEHHSNIVPWFIAKERYNNSNFKIDVEFLRIRKQERKGSTNIMLDIDEKKITNADIIAITLASNVLGKTYENEIKEIKRLNKDAIIVADATQYLPHKSFNLKKYIDFFAFSGHKMLSPTGVGVLIGKEKILNEMPASLGGGEMISEVTIEGYKPNELPYKFEAGTPNFVQAYGLAKAIDYLNKINMKKIENYENQLRDYMFEKMLNLEKKHKIKLITHNQNMPLFAFTHYKYHPHDIAAFLDNKNIAIRSGFHCAMPLHKALKIDGTARASLYFYNTFEEIDEFVNVLKNCR